VSKQIELNNDTIVQIVKCAKEIFGDGIYIPSDMHQCGWDFITFECISKSKDDILSYQFDNWDINDGNYDEHPYIGKTLKEILEITNTKFAFELNQIDW
jgi:hypothetical protein